MDQSTLIRKRIDEFFLEREENYLDIFRQLSFYIYAVESGTNHDLYMLAKILPKKYLDEIIDYFNGDVIKIPSKKEYRRSMMLCLAYFLKEIYKPTKGKELSWKEIKEIVSLPDNDEKDFSPLLLSKKINKIKDGDNYVDSSIKKKLNKDIEHIKEHLNNDLYTLVRDLQENDMIDLDEIVKEVDNYGDK